MYNAWARLGSWSTLFTLPFIIAHQITIIIYAERVRETRSNSHHFNLLNQRTYSARWYKCINVLWHQTNKKNNFNGIYLSHCRCVAYVFVRRSRWTVNEKWNITGCENKKSRLVLLKTNCKYTDWDVYCYDWKVIHCFA